MTRSLTAVSFVLLLLGSFRLCASPAEQPTALKEISLPDADDLTCELQKGFERAGFRLRYLGALANPAMRSSKSSGEWAARGFARGWNDVEISLSLTRTRPDSPYVIERTIDGQRYFFVIDGAGRRFDDVPLETLRSTEGASLKEVLDTVGSVKDLTSTRVELSRSFYDSLWESEREHQLQEAD